MKRVKKSDLSLRKTTKIIVSVIFGLYSLTLIIPLLWAVNASFMDEIEYGITTYRFATEFKLSNYVDALVYLEVNDISPLMMLFNSLYFTFGNIIIATAVVVCNAYVCARYKFPGSRLIVYISIFILMLPIMGNTAGIYRLYKLLGFLDSRTIVFSALGGGFGYTFLLYNASFKGISHTYSEAAFIDGMGHFQVFYKIMLPQVFPLITAISIMSFIGSWNDYMGPWLYYPKYLNIAAGLYAYQKWNARSLNYPVMFAGVLMSAVPVMVLFVSFQKYFLNVDLSGGLKG